MTLHHHHDEHGPTDIEYDHLPTDNHDHGGWHHHHGAAHVYDVHVVHNHPPSYHDNIDRFIYHHTIAGYLLGPADHEHGGA